VHRRKTSKALIEGLRERTK